uniref:Uncharacterized protein n=1 Tax=Ciona intestinalis TaxID=7719 RepID=H2XN43_CIOIN
MTILQGVWTNSTFIFRISNNTRKGTRKFCLQIKRKNSSTASDDVFVGKKLKSEKSSEWNSGWIPGHMDFVSTNHSDRWSTRGMSTFGY